MPIVVIDTNILMADFTLQGAGIRSLFEGASRCNLRVVVPELVIDELIGNYSQRLNKVFGTLSKVRSDLSRLLVTMDDPGFDAAALRNNYQAGVRAVFEVHGIEIAPYPDVALKEIVNMAYRDTKPFKSTGDGYKDYLIFKILLSLIEEAREDIWFLTNNSKDFCADHNSLHPELQAQLPGGLNISIFSSAKEFVDQKVIPQLERLDEIASEILNDEFENFNLSAVADEHMIPQLINATLPPHSFDDVQLKFNDAPTISSAGEYTFNKISVNRLGDELLLVEAIGEIELELSGFIEKVEWYGMPDKESDHYSVWDSDWNEWVMWVMSTVRCSFEMSVIYNDANPEVVAVAVDLSVLELV